MRVVFIAGPYRAVTAWGIESNIRKAELLALQLSRSGIVPVCVHSMYRYFQGEGSDDFWLSATQTLLLKCDAVLMIPGWERSSGSVAEKALAELNCIPVIELSESWMMMAAEDDRNDEWVAGLVLPALEG